MGPSNPKIEVSLREARLLSRLLWHAVDTPIFSISDLVEYCDLSRSTLEQRLRPLKKTKLISYGGLSQSTGGRVPRTMQFNPNAGKIIAVEMGAQDGKVAISNLVGEIIEQIEVKAIIADGPDIVLKIISDNIEQLLAKYGSEIWGIGIGLPGPVEFARGRLLSPPIMPGWDKFPIREYFAGRFNAPVFVDNEVNLMALGESRVGHGRGQHSFVYIKIGTGIGAGLVANGKLHRGESGGAGDLGHVLAITNSQVLCSCGNYGCLEAHAGGAAIAAAATCLAIEKKSPFLADAFAQGVLIDAALVGSAAEAGDLAAKKLIKDTGEIIGMTISTILNFYNPSLIVIGGGVSGFGDSFLSSIRQAVYKHSSPLSSRNLSIKISNLSEEVGIRGGAYLVLDELTKPERLKMWIQRGSPTGSPELCEISCDEK